MSDGTAMSIANRSIVYVVIGRMNMTHQIGPVGAATTREDAERIQRDNEWKLDESLICEVELIQPFGLVDLPAALERALPHAINFRFLPPCSVNDPIWNEIATDLVAALRSTPEADR